MAKKKIGDIVSDMIADYLKENDLELFLVEFVKEGRERFLRVYIDKPQNPDSDEDEYVSIGECEMVSRYLSDRLDETDPIEENYILEVSSPGMDRPLIRESDYVRYRGRLVDVSLYRNINGKKQFTATLEGLRDDIVLLEDDGETMEIPQKDISKIKLAVVF